MAATRILGALCLGLAALQLCAPAYAQEYPTKPIKLVSPYQPGGTTDILARLLAPKLQAALGQPVIVENKPGAGGNIGTGLVAKADPDGYTLLMAASGPIAMSPYLYKNLPYDPAKEFAAVIKVAAVPLALVAHPSFPAKTFAEFVAYVKKNPEKVNYASAGGGTPQHLSAEMFNAAAGTAMVHIPYKGSAPAIQDLLGGQVPVAFESLIPVLPHVKSGKLRALATTGPKRATSLPEVPTVSEGGVSGYEAVAWYGVLAPAKTPDKIVNRLNAELMKAIKSPEVAEKLATLGTDFVAGTPQAFGAFIRSEMKKWGHAVKISGATID